MENGTYTEVKITDEDSHPQDGGFITSKSVDEVKDQLIKAGLNPIDETRLEGKNMIVTVISRDIKIIEDLSDINKFYFAKVRQNFNW